MSDKNSGEHRMINDSQEPTSMRAVQGVPFQKSIEPTTMTSVPQPPVNQSGKGGSEGKGEGTSK
jgi:hypothetical protein